MNCRNCTRGRFLIVVVLAAALYFHDELKQIISAPEVKIKESYIGVTKAGSNIRYYPNGKIRNKGDIVNAKREGHWVWYFDTGQLKERGSYKNGRSEGTWVWYYKNGQLQFKGNYKNSAGYQVYDVPIQTFREATLLLTSTNLQKSRIIDWIEETTKQFVVN